MNKRSLTEWHTLFEEPITSGLSTAVFVGGKGYAQSILVCGESNCAGSHRTRHKNLSSQESRPRQGLRPSLLCRPVSGLMQLRVLLSGLTR